MSSTATHKVRMFSNSYGSTRLVMLCLAEYAGDDGIGACPAISTIQEFTGSPRRRLDRRTIQRALRALEGEGEFQDAPELYIPCGMDGAPLLSPFQTPYYHIIYQDGSNAEIIAAVQAGTYRRGMLALGGGGKMPPRGGKMPPESGSGESLYPNLSLGRESTTTKMGRQNATGGGKMPPPPPEAFADFKRRLLEYPDMNPGAGVDRAAGILLRHPEGDQALSTLLAFAHYRRLGAGWIIATLYRMEPHPQGEWMGDPDNWREYLPFMEAKTDDGGARFIAIRNALGRFGFPPPQAADLTAILIGALGGEAIEGLSWMLEAAEQEAWSADALRAAIETCQSAPTFWTQWKRERHAPCSFTYPLEEYGRGR